MKSKIQALINKKQFFNIISSSNNYVKYMLGKPSQILIRNIYINWLQYLYIKTQKVMPVYIRDSVDVLQKTQDEIPPFGIIKHKKFEFKNSIFDNSLDSLEKTSPDLELQLLVPQQDVMQYFIQWQRYRKYWWSSITTTPSLFAVGDIHQCDFDANVNIIANLPCGSQSVEHIQIKYDNEFKECASLTCKMSLESALFILLLDGVSNNSKEGYLRLHRNIAPYKMSFALNFRESKQNDSLKYLATLLFHRLKLERLSAWLPDFSLSVDEQIKENLQLGIPYTTILNENTLENGIFFLLNSSTMLKEQLHVADFHTYAAFICR